MASSFGLAAAQSRRSLTEMTFNRTAPQPSPRTLPGLDEDAVRLALDGHSAGAEEPQEGTGADKLVNDYISFIAMMRTEGRGTDAYQREVARLQSEVDGSASQGGSAEAVDSASVRLAVEEQASLVAFSGSSDGMSFAGVGMSASFSAEFEAEVRAADGTMVHVEGSVSVSFEATAVVVQGQQPQQSDPLLLDIDDDGSFALSGVDDGILFDINGDGVLDRTGFVRGGDVALALDRNGNGRIDDGRELFGDQHGAANGFAELARFDDDGNGRIDRDDAIFTSLVGVSAGPGGELQSRSLDALGVEAIELGYRSGSYQQVRGNTLAEEGRFIRTGGGVGRATDALFAYLPQRTEGEEARDLRLAA